MKLRLLSVLAICVLVGVIAGCSNDPVMPENAEQATGVTNASGIATISIGPYEVEVTVTTPTMSVVANANVICYLLHEHLLTVAGSQNGTYYPAMAVTSLADAQSRHNVGTGNPERVSSARVARTTDIAVELTMINASLGSHGYDADPENYNMIQSDSWTTETTQILDMPSFYALMDTIDYQGGVFVHLDNDIVLSTGAGRTMASFLLGRLVSFEAFASLMSLELRIFSGDTVTVTTMTYLDNQLSIMNISDISMYRNFWMQFTLTWGQDPGDLDSHLYTPLIPGPSDTTAYHIFFAARGYPDVPPYADLDVDDVTSYGPEHITIWENFPGTYIYAIYHYSGYGTIASSEAEVGVLKPDGAVQLFAVPSASAAQANYWWHVCNIDGTTGVITAVDTIAATSPGLAAGLYSGGGPEIMPRKNIE